MIEQVSVWNDLAIADPDFGPGLDKTKFSARDMFLCGESITEANEAWSTSLSQKSHTWNETQNKMWAKKLKGAGIVDGKGPFKALFLWL